MVDLIRRFPVVPVIGDGSYRRQPVHLEDFSNAILALLRAPLPRRAYEAGGGEALTFDEIIDTIAEAMNRCVRKLHVPKGAFVQMARLSRDFDPWLIRAVDEDELADPTELAEVTGVKFRGFAEGVRCLI